MSAKSCLPKRGAGDLYNRYVRNDQGSYTRVPPSSDHFTPPPPPQAQRQEFSPKFPPVREESFSDNVHHASLQNRPPELRWIDRLLKKLHLEEIDAGDLLLLLLLFILFHEEGDEEILFAIGLLLIM